LRSCEPAEEKYGPDVGCTKEISVASEERVKVKAKVERVLEIS